MNKPLKFLLLSIPGLLAVANMFVLLKVKIKAQTIVTRQLLVEEVDEFDLSPDGEYIAFCNTKGLRRLSLKSGKQEWLLHFPSQSPRCLLHSIKWSPDMTRIAFVHVPSRQLMILDLVTKELRIIDRAFGLINGVAWSPDGRQLAWIRQEEGERKAVWQYKLLVGMFERDKVHFKVLYEDKMGIYSPCWAADGQFLVFIGFAKDPKGVGGPVSVLGVIRSDGTNLKWLYPLGSFPIIFKVFSPTYSVSPDGMTVAYWIGGRLWLYFFKKPAVPPVKILSVGIRIEEIRWSPDGKGLLYVVPSQIKEGPMPPGMLPPVSPPYSLYWVDKEGKENRFILREEKAIRNLQWLKGRDIFYISGGALWKVTLR